MRHTGESILRAYLDGELDPLRRVEVEQHLSLCARCQDVQSMLRGQAALARESIDHLAVPAAARDAVAAWARFQKKREKAMENEQSKWSLAGRLSLAGAGLAIVAVIVVLTVAPVRAWAESLLAIFRVQRLTILEIDPSALKANGLNNNQLLNQEIGRVLSDEVTVTQQPQRPQLVTDQAAASKAAGFPVRLLEEGTPGAILLENGAGLQMKLNRDRIQAILEEAGRGDLQVPWSVDGATVAVRVPAGIMAFYGNCGDIASRISGKPSQPEQKGDSTCVSLTEIPSPVISAPPQVNPAQIAQIALEFMGMSANDAAALTQTIDWTSTLVLPVERGKTNFKQVHVNGNEAALLRRASQSQAEHYSLIWVDDGIVYALMGNGDDTTAVNLASQL